MIDTASGRTREFYECHPLVNFLYFGFVIGIIMFTMHPVFLVPAFLAGWCYSIFLGRKKALKFNLILSLMTVVLMTLVNGLFNHNGATTLFYVNDNAVTAEAFAYGLAAACMLVSVMVWFSCFNRIMSAEKIIYLFGKAAPVLGLTLSMIFRFIPLLKLRYKEIHEGQMGMGRWNTKDPLKRMRQRGKEISILLSWSLESSIETSDSMEARGYGLPGRTGFHLYHFQRRDITALAVILVLSALTIAGLALGCGKMNFYPEFIMAKFAPMTVVSAVSYGVLLLFPFIIDLQGERKWRS